MSVISYHYVKESPKQYAKGRTGMKVILSYSLESRVGGQIKLLIEIDRCEHLVVYVDSRLDS